MNLTTIGTNAGDAPGVMAVGCIRSAASIAGLALLGEPDFSVQYQVAVRIAVAGREIGQRFSYNGKGQLTELRGELDEALRSFYDSLTKGSLSSGRKCCGRSNGGNDFREELRDYVDGTRSIRASTLDSRRVPVAGQSDGDWDDTGVAVGLATDGGKDGQRHAGVSTSGFQEIGREGERLVCRKLKGELEHLGWILESSCDVRSIWLAPGSHRVNVTLAWDAEKARRSHQSEPSYDIRITLSSDSALKSPTRRNLLVEVKTGEHPQLQPGEDQALRQADASCIVCVRRSPEGIRLNFGKCAKSAVGNRLASSGELQKWINAQAVELEQGPRELASIARERTRPGSTSIEVEFDESLPHGRDPSWVKHWIRLVRQSVAAACPKGEIWRLTCRLAPSHRVAQHRAIVKALRALLESLR